MNELTHFIKAKQELALATNIDEIKEIRDKAEALRFYCKQAGESLEMQNNCAEIKIRAERRAGELLPDTIKEGNPQLSDDMTVVKLKDIGISRNQSSKYQQIATIPEDKFEEHIAAVKESNGELTSISTLRLAKQIQHKEHNENLLKIELPTGKYRTIIIDPPWEVQMIERDDRPNQTKFDYPTMLTEQIIELPIKDLCNESGSHIYLWTTQKYLPIAFEILDHWNIKYICTMVWHKSGGFQPFNLPQYNCEFVLFGRTGNLDFLTTKDFPCCFNGERQGHSIKPDRFYEIVQRVSPGPRLDMFARKQRDGFTVWGNEVTDGI